MVVSRCKGALSFPDGGFIFDRLHHDCGVEATCRYVDGKYFVSSKKMVTFVLVLLLSVHLRVSCQNVILIETLKVE